MDSIRRTALVTGASSGLGLTFADAFAARGYDLVLVARSADRLEQGAHRLSSRFGIDARAVPLDLAEPESWRLLADQVPTTDILVNNAGFASFGDVADTDPARLTAQIMLNCGALTALTRTYLPGMLERGHGVIVNIASTAAFQPIPTMAVYAATKAYVASFTTALWSEVKDTGVRVLGVCPGPTQTGFFTAGGDESVLTSRRSPDQVVATALAALDADRPLAIDGTLNSVTAFVARHAPAKLQTAAARFAVRPSRSS
ncbi:SDR family NAD(P)-dependent oxidoreductase [Propionicicella superfundia]|uniref:SDR family NAD(P)-dependent oxidoreductase n=1 Tax=Propionicicella superfundia TaxID=348582 RepID=UPI000421FD43|nr:SDR family oxidoreductase [Propionicicella superfundia]